MRSRRRCKEWGRKFDHEYRSAPKRFFVRWRSAAGNSAWRAPRESAARGGSATNKGKRRSGAQGARIHSGGEPALARSTVPDADEAGGHRCGGAEIRGAVSSGRIERGESRYFAAYFAGEFDGGYLRDSAGAIDGSHGANLVGGNDGRRDGIFSVRASGNQGVFAAGRVGGGRPGSNARGASGPSGVSGVALCTAVPVF